jgi:hypothetical protein
LPAPTYNVALYGNLEALDPSGQEVLFWYPYTGVREELLLTMIDEFNRDNEWGITVIGETWGNYDAVQQKITEGIPAQALPSLAVAYPYHAATYAAQDALVVLEPYLKSPRWGYTPEEWVDFFPGALAADVLPQFKARYGWPTYRTVDVLYTTRTGCWNWDTPARRRVGSNSRRWHARPSRKRSPRPLGGPRAWVTSTWRMRRASPTSSSAGAGLSSSPMEPATLSTRRPGWMR